MTIMYIVKDEFIQYRGESVQSLVCFTVILIYPAAYEQQSNNQKPSISAPHLILIVCVYLNLRTLLSSPK